MTLRLRLRFATAWIAALGGVVVPRAAWADERLELQWTAPEECPTAASVHAAAVADVAADTAGKPLDAEAHVASVDGRFRVELTTRSGTSRGVRSFEAATCQAAADATAVVLALALSEEPEEHVPPPLPVTTPADAPARSTATDVADDASHLALGAAFALDGTTLPRPAAGGSIHVAWHAGRLRAEASGALYGEQATTVAGKAEGASFSLWEVGGRGCVAAVRAPIAIAPCLGGLVRRIGAEGFGAVENYAESRLAAAGSGALAFRLPVNRWLALRALAEITLGPARPSFVVEAVGSVHQPSLFSGRLALGAEVDVF